MIKCNLLIIGAGASGMMAAIAAARNGCKNIIMLEGKSRVGKKLLSTGNGRCNISNEHISINRYHSNSLEMVKSILDSFDINKTKSFFKSIGIPFKQEGDKLFPYSLQASSVLDALRFECDRLNVKTVCDSKAVNIDKNGTVKTENEIYSAKCIIIATGGKAASVTGSDGSGYYLLKAIGHSIIDPQPTIVPLRTELCDIKALKGVRTDCKLTLKCGNDSVSYNDEVLFAEYGISGPAAMQLSRFISVKHKNKNVSAIIDFLPEMDISTVCDYLNNRKCLAFEGKSENLMLGLLHKRISQAVLKKSGLNINDDCRSYSSSDIVKICNNIKNYTVNVTGVCGFDAAQATAGGVCLNEFDCNLNSVFCDRIFACGEVLDCDGDCGGFNLQWAWSSGYIAGLAASERSMLC